MSIYISSGYLTSSAAGEFHPDPVRDPFRLLALRVVGVGPGAPKYAARCPLWAGTMGLTQNSPDTPPTNCTVRGVCEPVDVPERGGSGPCNSLWPALDFSLSPPPILPFIARISRINALPLYEF